jgi:hypothetical protein
MTPDQSSASQAPEQTRKPYSQPRLTVYGNVEEITRNIQPVAGSDGTFGSRVGT